MAWLWVPIEVSVGFGTNDHLPVCVLIDGLVFSIANIKDPDSSDATRVPAPKYPAQALDSLPNRPRRCCDHANVSGWNIESFNERSGTDDYTRCAFSE